MEPVSAVKSQAGALREIRAVNAGFPYTEPIRRWKEQGKKVIGWTCIYIPEEVIFAAGILPVRITADSKELALTKSTACSYTTLCTFARSCLELALNNQLDFLDGYVGSSVCHCISHLANVWRYYVSVPILDELSVPRTVTDTTERFFLGEILALKERLERSYGVQISDAALREAIQVYNRGRVLLKKLYELRKADDPPISGAEVLEVINASGRMPRPEFNRLLETLLDELNAGAHTPPRASSEKIGASSETIRLMMSGSILNNPEFLKDIESLGGSIVIDELCTGARYFWDLVDDSDAADPWEEIARRYLNNFACARMIPAERRIDQIMSLVEEYRVEGVIARIIRYCSNIDFDQAWLKERLSEKDIPLLELAVEYGMPVTGQVKTRVQAFLEMLEGRRDVE